MFTCKLIHLVVVIGVMEHLPANQKDIFLVVYPIGVLFKISCLFQNCEMELAVLSCNNQPNYSFCTCQAQLKLILWH